MAVRRGCAKGSAVREGQCGSAFRGVLREGTALSVPLTRPNKRRFSACGELPESQALKRRQLPGQSRHG